MAAGLLPGPGDVASGVLAALGRALSGGISSMAGWALGGVAHAATSTTQVRLDTWFVGPWRAMGAVAALCAVPLFFAGVLEALAKGEGLAGLARTAGRLLAASAAGAVILGVVQLLLVMVDVSCGLVETGSGVSLGAAFSKLAVALGAASAGGPGGAGMAGLFGLLAAMAAVALWVELALRSALLVLSTAFLPLGLAGLLWPATAGWLRRLAEVVAAVAASKLVIVVVLILGAAALNATPAMPAGAADVDGLVTGVAFLLLATMGLPMALRVVPVAAEAAMHAGQGRAAVRAAVNAPARLDARVGAAQSAASRLAGTAAVSGPAAAASPPGASPTAGPPPGRPPAPAGSGGGRR